MKHYDIHRFPYEWNLKNVNFTKDKGTVFSCFAGGGGSTMGYKLAGFDVIGCNEIDQRINDVYVFNHHPLYNFCCDIRGMLTTELPIELYQLDILDGSPPCSSFTMQGSREKGWGVKKRFKEGQAKQVLDTLFFDFISLAKRLQPKIVIAENVEGLMLGAAKRYISRIYSDFDKAGYSVCHTLLDASVMGVPQKRKRVFFTAIRKDLLNKIPRRKTLFNDFPSITFDFNEKPITFHEFADYKGEECLLQSVRPIWERRMSCDNGVSDTIVRLGKPKKLWNYRYVFSDRVPCTFVSERKKYILYDKPIFFSKKEVCCISTFPQDYNFLEQDYGYICGMSVPPVMMAQVANKVYEQWLKKIRL